MKFIKRNSLDSNPPPAVSARELEMDINKNVLIVDTSYYIFYRYFATLRWYQFQNTEPASAAAPVASGPETEATGAAVEVTVTEPKPARVLNHATLHENGDFVEAFKRHIKQDFEKLCKKWDVESSNIIFCLDCPRAEIWRMKIFPDYKGKRKLASNFNGNIFPVFYKFAEDEGYTMLSSKNLEADDVVYLCTKHFRARQTADASIIIITNDNDYLQIKSERIEIYNMMGRDITLRSTGNAKDDLLKKILIGDISDCIPNICPKMGEKTAQKLVNMTEADRDKWIDAKGCRKQYELNRTLIDFTYIPAELTVDFEKFLGKFLEKLI